MLWGEPGLRLWGEVGIDACCGVNLAWGCGGAGAIRFLLWSFRVWRQGFSMGGEGSFDLGHARNLKVFSVAPAGLKGGEKRQRAGLRLLLPKWFRGVLWRGVRGRFVLKCA